jgi:hypothetical protein
MPGAFALILASNLNEFIFASAVCIVTAVVAKYTVFKLAIAEHYHTLMCIAISATFGIIVQLFSEYMPFPTFDTMISVYIIPGLFAASCARFGFLKVVKSSLPLISVSYIFSQILAFAIPMSVLSASQHAIGGYSRFVVEDIYVMLPISLCLAFATYWAFGQRTGGYLAMPIIATICYESPIQGGLIIGAIIVTYVIITIIMRYTHIIGLERFVVCLAIAVFMNFIINIVAGVINVPFYVSSITAASIAIAVVANDLSLNKLQYSLLRGTLPSFLIMLLVRWSI